MPCCCWVSDDHLEPEMAQIKSHMKEIVRLLYVLNTKGDFHQKGDPAPRCLLKDTHKLLDDLATGRCDEKENQ